MKSDRSAGLGLAAAVFGGAISGGAVWFFLSRMAVINGRGLLSRTGPPAGGLRPPMVPPSMLLAFFGIVPGLVVGAIAGSWLGGRIADRFYRPTPDDLPAPKISKGWVIAGAFLGWVVGVAIGMALTMVITRQVLAPWVMPIVFFSPAVLGGFAGSSIARRRAARRTGD